VVGDDGQLAGGQDGVQGVAQPDVAQPEGDLAGDVLGVKDKVDVEPLADNANDVVQIGVGEFAPMRKELLKWAWSRRLRVKLVPLRSRPERLA
jgi:hypothetical protein